MHRPRALHGSQLDRVLDQVRDGTGSWNPVLIVSGADEELVPPLKTKQLQEIQEKKSGWTHHSISGSSFSPFSPLGTNLASWVAELMPVLRAMLLMSYLARKVVKFEFY